MILMKRKYTIGSQELSTETPSDPNLLPLFSFRDEFTQTGEGPEPRYASGHIFDMSNIATGALFLPNLGMLTNTASEIVFYMQGPNAPTWSIENDNTKSRSGDLYVLWVDGVNLYFYDGAIRNIGTLSSGELAGFERKVTNEITVVKYDTSKAKSTLYSAGVLSSPTTTWYPKAFDMQGAEVRYLQYKGAVIVNNAGIPI